MAKPRQETMYQKRARRVRHKLDQINRSGLPRLSVHRSGRHMYAQVIDDRTAVTVAAASTLDADLQLANGGTVDAASKVGQLIAERAKKAGIEKVQFDRGGYLYHGRVKALAEGARASGLQF